MNDRKREERLWEIAEVVPDRSCETLSDATLAAYCEGRLDAEQSARVEASLIGSAELRRRLIERAGDGVLQPPEWIWQSLQHGGRGRDGSRRGWLAAAAALLVLTLVPATWWVLQPRDELPRSAYLFDVRVEGLAELRSEASGALAHPDTRVRILIAPGATPRAAVRYALYRDEAGRLVRISEGEMLRNERERGSALFEVRADRLVDPSPGEHRFYVVASSAATPRTIDTRENETPLQALERATAGRAEAHDLRIVPPPALP